MKKTLIILLSILAFNSISFGKEVDFLETKFVSNEEINDGYTDWLFIQGDKALQYRFKQVKEEDGIGYFQVQVRINFEDKIFCNHPTCVGYLFVFGYPSLETQTNIETSYKFYNTFKGIYTITEIIPIKLDFSDGSKRILRKDGFFYTLPGSDEESPIVYLFGNCVDIILSNYPNNHNCKPYRPEFKESEAIVIQ